MRSFNIALIARNLCFLLIFEAVFMVIPLLTAFINNESGAARAFGISALITIAVGAGGYRFIRPRRNDMSKYDSVLLTALVWIVFSLFGQIPYQLAPTTRLGFSAAFFEAMSGFTTTGASLIESTDQLSHAIHIWRCLSQWIGGLGIIILTLALVPMLNSSGGMQMFNAEQNRIGQEKIGARISTTSRRIWGVYVLLTSMLFALLCIGPMSAFESACYAFSTMSTGGFSTSPLGINAYNSVYVKIIIALFMFLGGVNFAMVYRAAIGQTRAVVRNEAFLTYCKAIGLATLVFIACILVQGVHSGWQSLTIDPLFQVVSLMTSTGFILTPFDSWGTTVMALSMILIFVGGCAGSTSGGAKIDRVVYLLKFLKNETKRTMRPKAVLPVRISSRVISASQVNEVVAFLCLYVLLILAGSVLLCMCNIPIEQSFVASMAAMGNASLSIADSSMGCDYLSLGNAAHYVLATMMLIGRLEIFTIIVLFTRTFWRR